MDYFCGHSQLFQPQIARPCALIFAESAARLLPDSGSNIELSKVASTAFGTASMEVSAVLDNWAPPAATMLAFLAAPTL